MGEVPIRVTRWLANFTAMKLFSISHNTFAKVGSKFCSIVNKHSKIDKLLKYCHIGKISANLVTCHGDTFH